MTRQALREFIVFCIIGFLGLLINLAVTYFFTEFLGWYYFLSYLIGIVVCWTFIFFANFHFTFDDHDKVEYFAKYLKFMSGYAVLFTVNASLVFILTSVISIHYIISIIIAAAITTTMTFIFSKKVVFTRKS